MDSPQPKEGWNSDTQEYDIKESNPDPEPDV